MILKIVKILLLSIILITSKTYSKDHKIIVASTTSTYDTGLLNYLNEKFTNNNNIHVQVLSQGTGQAIRTAKDGNAEILLVHHKDSEIKFMNQGYGLERHEIMYNDYLLVGPKTDNDNCDSVEKKFFNIYINKYLFVSRGDESGTHKKEMELWKLIKLNPVKFSNWYLNVGQGMGNTLLIANEKRAYTLIDRSTWIAFSRKQNLKIVCENFPPMFNQYGIILVNPKINKNLNIQDGKKYIDWFISDQAKYLINSFTKNGMQLFFYNHH